MRRWLSMSCVLVLALTACSSTDDQPPPDLATMASPCDFLDEAQRTELQLGPGQLSTAPGLAGGTETTLCVYRDAALGDRGGDYVDSVTVTFLPTTLDVARRALDEVEQRGLFTAGRMSAYATGPDGVLRRAGVRLGETTCERLFAASPTRAVQIGLTVERPPLGEAACDAAVRLAPSIFS
ncbi:hypothetical protein O7635_00615 [Asanoa sp. WMMD1127]|uniref:hypothetical protein n=1 Tax=Asanoa sp. WMMD1127 TaxID=3016107 RepID=UPI0024174A7B|nr:hypothetical protein [Asanoa sp. WMMD1127]MDG4820352.1 hypothetical protein [Asanoa sp. WMMD1127]